MGCSAGKAVPVDAVTSSAPTLKDGNALASDVMDSTASSDLQQEGGGNPALIIPENALRMYVRIFNVRFQEMKTMLDDNCSLLKMVLLAADPPYNVWRDARKPGLDYDTFTKWNVAEMLERRENILKPGGHGHVLSSNL